MMALLLGEAECLCGRGVIVGVGLAPGRVGVGAIGLVVERDRGRDRGVGAGVEEIGGRGVGATGRGLSGEFYVFMPNRCTYRLTSPASRRPFVMENMRSIQLTSIDVGTIACRTDFMTVRRLSGLELDAVSRHLILHMRCRTLGTVRDTISKLSIA